MDAIMAGTIAGVPTPVALLALGAALTVTLLGAVAVAGRSARTQRRKRMSVVVKRVGGGQARAATLDAAGVYNLRKRGGGGSLDGVAGRLLPRPELLRARLAATGKDITLGRYLLANLGCMAAATLAIWLYVGLPIFAAALLGFAVGLFLPFLVTGVMASRRKGKFMRLFPEAIDLIVRGLKSGLPVTESMNIVADEIQDPVGSEFRQVGEMIKVGQSMEESLWATANRLNLQEFKFFVVSLSIQRETGGNLAETLANLSDMLRKRAQAKLKVKAMSSEAKASATIIGALPFVMFVILDMISDGYTDPLLNDPRGQIMLAGGLAWLFMGVATMMKMVRFEI